MYPNLKLQLWKTGIRQNRLSQMLGMDETQLSKILNGFRQPTPEMQERIATLLHSDAAWLFERMSGPEEQKDEGPLPAGGSEPRRT
jgi:transcriptional regulator with XRE-family HTH domain